MKMLIKEAETIKLLKNIIFFLCLSTNSIKKFRYLAKLFTSILYVNIKFLNVIINQHVRYIWRKF